eukprot:gnl/MRDRNA2_/MRDRNA2_70080_c0_seq1.p1 gnl/MRDRNA2_/MRDRNA2_70080_c0~~gnl/MRDRNA2_/MRDRNA2_70080_c0_seq1.p1  ORF type:complete len:761 (-),score=134.83 gnl/MRDRNA2_/MRDRNA2_70080_c0_seq1:12-2144(-)
MPCDQMDEEVQITPNPSQHRDQSIEGEGLRQSLNNSAQPKDVTEQNWSALVLTFGKHQGRTFVDVRNNEPDYVSWALRQADPSGYLKPFVDYLRSECVITSSAGSPNLVTRNQTRDLTEPRSPEAMRDGRVSESSPGTVLTFGKHRKRTFADVRENEPAYTSWALRQLDPSSNLKAFVNYLKAEGFDQPLLTNQSEVSWEAVTWGSALLTVGKHRGRTFADVKQKEPNYVFWALMQNETSGNLKQFVHYLIAQGAIWDLPMINDALVGPDRVFTTGKHKGRRFIDLIEEEPEYVSWALKQPNPSGDLKEFVDYLKLQGQFGGQKKLERIWGPNATLTRGKHQGRTWADVKKNEPDYVSWALRQQAPSGDLKPFVDYLKSSEGSGRSSLSSPSSNPVQQSNPQDVPGNAGPGTVMTFGKHKGRTFADLKDHEPEYVSWALGQAEPSGHLQAFVEYLKSQGVDGSSSKPSQPGDSTHQSSLQDSQGSTGADTVMAFGKYKGRTFADLKEHEPDYVSWALGQADPSGPLQAFLEYLKSEGVSLSVPSQPSDSVQQTTPQASQGPDTVMTVGKHKGRTFADLKNSEPEYVSWALGQADPSGQLQAFVDYLKSEGVSAGQTVQSQPNLTNRGSTPAPQGAVGANTVITFGKHKGRTFGDIKDNEPEYTTWALGHAAASPELQVLIDYLRSEGVVEGLGPKEMARDKFKPGPSSPR